MLIKEESVTIQNEDAKAPEMDVVRILELSLNSSKAIHAFHIEVGLGMYTLHNYLKKVYEDLDEFGDSLGEIVQGENGQLELGIDLNRTPVDEPKTKDDVISFLYYFIDVINKIKGGKAVDNLVSNYSETFTRHISMLLRL